MQLRLSLLPILIGLALLPAPQVLAQAMLKPNGANAAPLVLKSMDAEVRIAGPVAVTTLTLRFANPHPNRIEADFMYRLPEGGVATGFAYWYEKEKVIARIAEKERAAQIYKYITTRQRDPALVELIGKNTLRARIFPVMPNADLQVELKFVRALPREKDGSAVFTLPLALEKTAPALESCQVKIAVEGWRDIKNNLGAAVAGGRLAYGGKEFRPNSDLRLRLTPEQIPLSPLLHAAPSGGAAGFFTLTMAGRGKASLTGLPFYDVRQRPLGSGWLVTGRYKGTGVAKVTRRAESAALTFGAAPEPNGPAVKLWGSEKLQALGKGSRKEAIALSLRHGIVCAHTSWIAIPEEERRRYEQEKQQAELDLLAGRLVKAIKAGREDREARARFDELCQKFKRNASQELGGYFEGELYDLAHKAVRGNKKDQRALQSLARRIAISPKSYLEDARQQWASERQYRLQTRLDALMRKGREDWEEFRKGLAQNDALAKDSRLNLRGSLFASEAQMAAQRIAAARLDNKPDPEEDVRLLERVKNALGRETDLNAARKVVLERRYQESAVQWLQALRTNHSPDAAKARTEDLAEQLGLTPDVQRTKIEHSAYMELQLQTRNLLDAIRKNAPEVPRERETLLKMLTLTSKDPEQKLARAVQEDWYLYNGPLYDLARVHYSPRLDRAKAAELDAQLKRVETLAGIQRPQDTEVSSSWNPAEEQTRAELLAERRKPHPDPARIAALSKTLLEQTTSRNGADYAQRRMNAIQAEAEWEALERAGASPEKVTAAATKAKELRARFGDPLLPIDAPQDARQVVARFADGTVKPLAWNAVTRRWELRFDVPPHATEGSWDIQVTILHADGRREERLFPVTVDMKAPEAKAALTRLPDGRLRLDVKAVADAARATVFFAGAEPLALTPTGTPGGFFALLPGNATEIRVVVTDSAHNRTEITEVPLP